MRSVPPVNNVRLSGKKATDHTGRPGPISVRTSLRALRSITATEPRMPAAAIELAVARDGELDDRRRRGFDLAAHFAGGREEEHLAAGAGGGDLAVGRDRHRVQRARQIAHDDAAAVDLPDAQGGVIAGADHLLAVGREGDAVDVLRIAFEHARRAAGKRPQPHAVIPRGRGERLAVRRDGKIDDRAGMAVEHLVGRLLARASRSQCERRRRRWRCGRLSEKRPHSPRRHGSASPARRRCA